MEIAVDGWRSSVAEWNAVRSLAVDELPPLSREQREVAKKLGVAEQDYARSAVVGERTRETLLRKAERFARLLEQKMQALRLQGRWRATDIRIEVSNARDYYVAVR